MKKLLFIFSLFVLVSIQACKNDEDDDTPRLTNDQLKILAVDNYVNIVYATYDDCYKNAVTLNSAINEFTKAPTAAKLKTCKEAWYAARTTYGQAEAFRFESSPINVNEVGQYIDGALSDELNIDYVADNETTGIVNNTSIPITKEKLLALHTTTSATTGYHVIEFLLWGQDLSANTCGIRPHTDYVIGEGSTASNNDRRGEYLKLASQLLADHLMIVRDEWKEKAVFREDFKNDNMADILKNIFEGMITVSRHELADNLLFTAEIADDEKKERSRFSDTTRLDILTNFKGIRNVYNGSYTRVDGSVIAGPSFSDIAGRITSSKNEDVATSFTSIENGLKKISSPFDQAIFDDHADIENVKEQLKTLAEKLAEVSTSLGAKVE